MPFAASTRRLLAWCATLAMLMAVLAPTVSRGLATAPGSTPIWAEICSVSDSKSRNDAAAVWDHSAPSRLALHFDHCPYCHFDGDMPALLAASASPLLATLTPSLHPLLFFQAPHTLHAWSAAQPRAPPDPLS